MKSFESKLKHVGRAVLICGALFALPFGSYADTSFTINNTTADAFLASGSANNPVGAISPA